MAARVCEKPKGSGKYGVRIYKDGKEKFSRTGSRAEAEHLARQVNAKLSKINLGLVVRPKNDPLFKEYATLWLDTYIKPPMRAEGTYVKYNGLLDSYILPELGRTRVTKITRPMVRDALLSIYRKNNISRSLLDVMVAVLSGIFASALDDELINANPVKDITKSLRLPKEMKKEVNPLTAKQSKKVLAAIREKHPSYYPLYYVLFTTGMRLGEACGLRWADVDLERRIITIRRTAARQTVSNRTKAKQIRTVDMSSGLVAVMREQKKQAEAQEKGGVGCEYCFHKRGKLLYQTTLRRAFARCLDHAGLDHRRIHDIRHTYASRLLSAGQSVVYVSKQLGHSSIQITVDTYTHWIPQDGKSPTDLLDV